MPILVLWERLEQTRTEVADIVIEYALFRSRLPTLILIDVIILQIKLMVLRVAGVVG